MKRKITVVILILIYLLSLAACNMSAPASVLTVNGDTDIGSDIFTYFLDNAIHSSPGLDKSRYIEYATSKCLEYVVVNTRLAATDAKISQNDKAKISRETNALWRSYGKYYTDIGMTKDTLFKIKQYESAKETLRFSLYDTGGMYEINENYLKQYFEANYVGIKYFYEELYEEIPDDKLATLDDSAKITYQAEQKAASDRYSEIATIADYANSGTYTIDQAFMAVTGEVSADISVSASVVGKTDTSFSKEFIDSVFKQAVGSTFIITNKNKSYVYFIQRVNVLDDNYGFYKEYRDDCLKAVSENYFVNEINNWIGQYNATRHSAVANSCYNAVTSVDRSKYVGTEGYKFKSIKIER